MTFNPDGTSCAKRRGAIEAALAQYPHLQQDRLDDVLHWFRKEASALDVALVASNPSLTEPYARFRAEHIDKFGPRDLLRAALFVTIVAGIALALMWRAF